MSLLQSEMDADSAKLLFTYEQVGDHTLKLTATSAQKGIDVKISGDADQATDATRLIGFSEAGSSFSEITLNASSSTAYTPRQIEVRGEHLPVIDVDVPAIQVVFFSGSLSDIGDPSVGDAVSDNSTGTGTIAGIIESPPDSKTALVILGSGSLDPGAQPFTLNSATYTFEITAVNFISGYSFRVTSADSDGSIGTGSATQLTDGTYATLSALSVAESSTAAGQKAAVDGFGTAVSAAVSALKGWSFDRLFTVSAVSSQIPSYSLGDGTTIFHWSEDVTISIVATDSGSDLQTSLTYGDIPTLLSDLNLSTESYSNSRYYPDTDLSSAGTAAQVLVTYSDYSLYGTVDGAGWGGSLVPTSAAEVDTIVELLSVLTGSDYDVETIAQSLNAHSTIPFLDSDGTTRAVLFYVPVDSSAFLQVGGENTVGVRALDPLTTGFGVTMEAVTVPATSPFAGTTVDYAIRSTGTSSTGEAHTVYMHPTAPTLFSATAGAAELLFVATGSESAFQVFPGETSTGKVAPKDLYRDLNLSTHYTDAKTFTATFSSEAYASPLLAGVRTGTDILRIYEQKVSLAVAGSGGEVLPEKFDRVTAGSDYLRVLCHQPAHSQHGGQRVHLLGGFFGSRKG